MTERTRSLLQSLKHKRVGLFVDNANWFYPQQELGWRISFDRLSHLLNASCYLAPQYLYAGTPLTVAHTERFRAFTDAAAWAGFLVVTKPLKKIWVDRKAGTFVHKCNFDVEITLDVATRIKDMDVVILGSGDSDFLAVERFARKHKKEFIALCFERGIAWEMRQRHHIFLEDLRAEIEKQ